MNKTMVFPAKQEAVGEVAEKISRFLKDLGADTGESMKTLLVLEETLGGLVEHAAPGSELKVVISRFMGKIDLEISVPGEDYDPARSMKEVPDLLDNIPGDAIQNAIRGILLSAYGQDMKFRHKYGKNHVRMTVLKSKRIQLYRTLIALILGILTGLILMRTGNTGFNAALNKYLLVPVKTLFLNSMKAIVAPVVFFSIVSCISRFSNLADLERVGAKVFISYLCTSVIATAVGLGTFFLLKPGIVLPGVQAAAKEQVQSSIGDAALESIIGIVPDNFIKPFLESNMLQLIFLAVLCGIAVGLIGEYSEPLRNLMEACNEMFLRIITMIMLFIPAAVFCSVSSLIISVGVDTLLSLLGIAGSFIFGIFCMMIIYCLILILFGRLNPLTFIKKYFSTMLQVFSIAASTPSIPVNMKACEENLGIDRKVYSLSIPLGATVNMDGTCVLLAVQTLALAKMYGVPVTGASVFSLAISILVFSIGAPGVPGSLMIIMAALLSQLNVPVEGLEIVIGLAPFLGMFLAASNCLGDVIVTAVVARSEGLMDVQRYNS